MILRAFGFLLLIGTRRGASQVRRHRRQAPAVSALCAHPGRINASGDECRKKYLRHVSLLFATVETTGQRRIATAVRSATAEASP